MSPKCALVANICRLVRRFLALGGDYPQWLVRAALADVGIAVNTAGRIVAFHSERMFSG